MFVEFFKQCKEFIIQFSGEIGLFGVGSIGTAYMIRSDKELTKRQRRIRYIFGGVFAMFSTPLFVDVFEGFTDIKISTAARYGVAFYLGTLGMEGLLKLINVVVLYIYKLKKPK